VRRAVLESWNGSTGFVGAHWQADTIVALGTVLTGLFLYLGSDQDLFQSLLPLFALPAAFLVLFLAYLVSHPFRDHRRLVAERDHFKHLVRTIHLRYHAQDMWLWSSNEIRVLRDVINRGHSFEPNQWFGSMRDYLTAKKRDLVRWGQPTLAAQISIPDEAPTTVQECMALVEPLNLLFIRWRSGGDVIPPFAESASDEGLQLPMLYGP
jgi:hypothetical protein